MCRQLESFGMFAEIFFSFFAFFFSFFPLLNDYILIDVMTKIVACMLNNGIIYLMDVCEARFSLFLKKGAIRACFLSRQP